MLMEKNLLLFKIVFLKTTILTRTVFWVRTLMDSHITVKITLLSQRRDTGVTVIELA